MARGFRNVSTESTQNHMYDPLTTPVENTSKKSVEKRSSVVTTIPTTGQPNPLDLFLNFSGCKLVTITPTFAQYVLKNCNTINRPLNKKRVTSMANALKNGEWQINGETIVFSRNKRLLDGQYRLSAIAAADKEVESFVVTDIEEDAFETIDTGKARTGSHVLSIKKTKHSFSVAATLNKINRFYNRNYDFDGAGVLTNRQLLGLAQQHPDVTKSVERFTKYSRDISKTTLAFCHYVLNQIDAATNETLFSQLNEKNPTIPIIAVLKKHVSKDKSKGTHRLKQTAIIGAIFKTWNAMRTNTPTSDVAISVKEEFPIPQ